LLGQAGPFFTSITFSDNPTREDLADELFHTQLAAQQRGNDGGRSLYVGIEFPRIESRRVIVAGFARVSVKHCRSRSRFAADIQWNSSWRIRRERSRSSIASN